MKATLDRRDGELKMDWTKPPRTPAVWVLNGSRSRPKEERLDSGGEVAEVCREVSDRSIRSKASRENIEGSRMGFN